MKIKIMSRSRHELAEWASVETLEETNRGDGGFGYTGKE
jgi:dUTPase